MKLGKLAIRFNVIAIVVSVITAVIGFINGNQELLNHFLSPAQASLVVTVVSTVTLILHGLAPQGKAIDVVDTSTGNSVEINTAKTESSTETK